MKLTAIHCKNIHSHAMMKGQYGYTMKLLIAVVFALAMAFILYNAALYLQSSTHQSPTIKIIDGLRSARSAVGVSICVQSVIFMRNEEISQYELQKQATIDSISLKGCSFIREYQGIWMVEVPGPSDLLLKCTFSLGKYDCEMECVYQC